MDQLPHALRPIKPACPRGRHLLLWVSERHEKRAVVPGLRRAWLVDLTAEGWILSTPGQWTDVDGLEAILETSLLPTGETTIWLARGWSDLVLTGLAELLDAAIITWRYANLSGASCLLRGLWRGRKICTTSLGNWTGGQWDSWKNLPEDPTVQRLLTGALDAPVEIDPPVADGEGRALETLAALAGTCRHLCLPRLTPTSGAAGILCWRAWLGPRVRFRSQRRGRPKRSATSGRIELVVPLPVRPRHAAAAERQVCYGLTVRQLRQGRVEGPLYCLDLRNAYLMALLTMPVPVSYNQTLRKPAVEKLIDALVGRTGLALVSLHSPDVPYPWRRGGRTQPAVGTYWTWLAGTELCRALCENHVRSVWCAHVWTATRFPNHKAEQIVDISALLSRERAPGTAAGWRAVYSSLVGRFAGWRSHWVDAKTTTNFGRWSTWEGADPVSGDVVPYRSIAGHVQYLGDKSDRTDGVPLLFGLVTSQVRDAVAQTVQIAGLENVALIHADSLWCTARGWQNLQRYVSSQGFAPDWLRCKSIYDRAWMNGRSVAVTERHGQRVLHLPGVSTGTIADADGKILQQHTEPWTSDDAPTAVKGVRRRVVRYATGPIVARYDHAALVLPPAETVNEPLLPESLLQPVRGRRSVDDA
jgi:hypothetical protein